MKEVKGLLGNNDSGGKGKEQKGKKEGCLGKMRRASLIYLEGKGGRKKGGEKGGSRKCREGDMC